MRASHSYAVPPNNKGINRTAASSISPHARPPLHPRRLNISQNEIRCRRIDNGRTVARHFHGNNDFIVPPAEKPPLPQLFCSFSRAKWEDGQKIKEERRAARVLVVMIYSSGRSFQVRGNPTMCSYSVCGLRFGANLEPPRDGLPSTG